MKSFFVKLLAKLGFVYKPQTKYRNRVYSIGDTIVQHGGIEEAYYTSKMCAELLGVTESTFLNWHRKGYSPKAIGRLNDAGGGFAFRCSEIDEFIGKYYGLKEDILTMEEICEAFGQTSINIRRMITKSVFPDADYKGVHDLNYRWKKTTIQAHRKDLTVRDKYVSECVSIDEAAKVFGTTSASLQRWHRDGLIDLDLVRVEGRGLTILWHKPTLIKIASERTGYPPSEFYKQIEVLAVLGISSNASLQHQIKRGDFPPACFRGLNDRAPVWRKSIIHEIALNSPVLIKRAEVMEILGYSSKGRFKMDLDKGNIPRPHDSALTIMQWDREEILKAKAGLKADWNGDFITHENEEYIPFKKACEMLGIGETTLRKYISLGRLSKPLLLGRGRRRKSSMKLSEIIKFMESRNKAKKSAVGLPKEAY